jgi:uncharacterized protein (DUF983 family)
MRGRPPITSPIPGVSETPEPSLLAASLRGLCPRCGSKTLFGGGIQFAGKCRTCGLDFSSFNVGDGPAAFLTLIVGALVTVMALTLDAAVQPPFWVHIVIWVPVTALAVIYGLRVGKAALLGVEYRQKAGEGRQRDDERGDGSE